MQILVHVLPSFAPLNSYRPLENLYFNTMTHQAESRMNAKLGGVLKAVGVGIIGVFAIGVFAYNGSLGVRREYAHLQSQVDELQVLNVELKNRLYELTDANSLGDVAIRLGLVVEKNPQYLHVGEAVVAQRN